MQVNVNQLKEWFSAFNKRYFGGGLPEPVLAVGRSRTRLGTMSWRTRRGLFSRSACDYTIRISNGFDMDERHFKSVLLHEMIHLYIVSGKIKDTSAHGVAFRRMMKSINADGWDIRVATRMGNEVKATGRPKQRRRVVLAVVTTGGKHILTVVNPRYVAALDRIMAVSRDVKTHSWHVSDDDYFALFPAVRTPKGRVVTAEVYNEKVAAMEKLEI